MNEAQLNLVLASLSTMITVLIGILINNARLNDMRDMWRAELHRVEEVLDARLKHL